MKTKLIFFFFITLTLKTFGQNDSILKYTYTPENIVASAMDGTWKSAERERLLMFKKDTTILKALSPKYYDILSDRIIYHVGHLSFRIENREASNLYFILTEYHGIPFLVIFEEEDGNLTADEPGYIFIVKGDSKEEDKLILSTYTESEEFVRIE